MVALSRFAHAFDLGENVALYHSLRMRPVFLTNETYRRVQAWLASAPSSVQESSVPVELRAEIDALLKARIITKEEGEDERVLAYVRSKIPKPATNVCYMILSEQCNLACKYCFLGNNTPEKRMRFSRQSMQVETADKAIDFFIRQIKESGLDHEDNEPVVIFYGGEPLVNYPVLVHIAERFNALRETEPCLRKINLSMVTNGLLLNRERLLKLKDLGVSIAISIDGFSEEANQMRVDLAGKPVFNKIVEKLDLCRELGVDVSLSVTISQETLHEKKQVLELINKYGIKSLGFNIMMSSDTFIVPQSYNEEAAQFIIDVFAELREIGVYEDRIMRKLKAFSKEQVYFSDCAATSGGQIVVAPNGQVGICHGCLHDKRYFVSNVDDSSFVASRDETFMEWAQLSPVNNESCLDCAALGICGGGCPINAMYLKPGNTIHSIDERFCSHAKRTLDFFIHDLFRIVSARAKDKQS